MRIAKILIVGCVVFAMECLSVVPGEMPSSFSPVSPELRQSPSADKAKKPTKKDIADVWWDVKARRELLEEAGLSESNFVAACVGNARVVSYMPEPPYDLEAIQVQVKKLKQRYEAELDFRRYAALHGDTEEIEHFKDVARQAFDRQRLARDRMIKSAAENRMEFVRESNRSQLKEESERLKQILDEIEKTMSVSKVDRSAQDLKDVRAKVYVEMLARGVPEIVVELRRLSCEVEKMRWERNGMAMRRSLVLSKLRDLTQSFENWLDTRLVMDRFRPMQPVPQRRMAKKRVVVPENRAPVHPKHAALPKKHKALTVVILVLVTCAALVGLFECVRLLAHWRTNIDERYVRIPESVVRCGFCGGAVTPYETMYVSLSRQQRIGYKKCMLDKVGFCVPCCPDCLSRWKRRYNMRLVLLFLYFCAGFGLCFLGGRFLPLLLNFVVVGVCLLALVVKVVVSLKGYGVWLMETLDIPWMTKLSDAGYEVDVMSPRRARNGKDTKEKKGEVVRLGHGHKLIEYYTWKGCEDCKLAMRSFDTERSAPYEFLVFLSLFLWAGGILAIWGGCFALAGYLYFSPGHVGETSFGPLVISVVLAIVASYGFVHFFCFSNKDKHANESKGKSE